MKELFFQTLMNRKFMRQLFAYPTFITFMSLYVSINRVLLALSFWHKLKQI